MNLLKRFVYAYLWGWWLFFTNLCHWLYLMCDSFVLYDRSKNAVTRDVREFWSDLSWMSSHFLKRWDWR